MLGLIFAAVGDIVTERFGEDAWDEILGRADLDGAYTVIGDYPDEQLLALVAAASELLDTPPDDVVRLLGRGAFAVLADHYGDMSTMPDLRSLLLALNDVIHPEVRRLYPGARPPVFEASTHEGRLRLRYRSSRGLCTLAEGLILGAADHFGTRVSVSQVECVHHGAESCLLEVVDDPG